MRAFAYNCKLVSSFVCAELASRSRFNPLCFPRWLYVLSKFSHLGGLLPSSTEPTCWVLFISSRWGVYLQVFGGGYQTKQTPPPQGFHMSRSGAPMSVGVKIDDKPSSLANKRSIPGICWVRKTGPPKGVFCRKVFRFSLSCENRTSQGRNFGENIIWDGYVISEKGLDELPTGCNYMATQVESIFCQGQEYKQRLTIVKGSDSGFISAIQRLFLQLLAIFDFNIFSVEILFGALIFPRNLNKNIAIFIQSILVMLSSHCRDTSRNWHWNVKHSQLKAPGVFFCVSGVKKWGKWKWQA